MKADTFTFFGTIAGTLTCGLIRGDWEVYIILQIGATVALAINRLLIMLGAKP